MASIAVIINPTSRRNSARLRSRVVRRLAASHEVETAVTRARGDATHLARQAADAGARIVVTMGGDGTVNEAALALQDRDVLLCPLPIGGTNVFARALGWPAAPDAAVGLLLGAIERPDESALDIRTWRIRVGEEPPVLVCLNAGVGIDAETVAHVERRPAAKRRLGQGAYAAAAALTAETTARRGDVLSLRCDGGPSVDCASVTLAIGGPYAYLGRIPLDLLPDARFQGRLHWLAIRGGRRIDFARIVVDTLRRREPTPHAALVRGAAADELAITCSTPVAVQVDGEPLGAHRDIHFSPGGRVRVLAPNAESVAQVGMGGAR